MDWKEFIVQIINILIWPVILLIFLYFFKEQIQGLIESLKKLTIGNASAVFSKEQVAERFPSKFSNSIDDGEISKEPIILKEDIFKIPDADYEFMQEIAGNEKFMPIHKSEVFKYNALVNHGYFEKENDDTYRPTKKGAEIINALKSIYHSS